VFRAQFVDGRTHAAIEYRLTKRSLHISSSKGAILPSIVCR